MARKISSVPYRSLDVQRTSGPGDLGLEPARRLAFPLGFPF
jgi:hypothetical protein